MNFDRVKERRAWDLSPRWFEEEGHPMPKFPKARISLAGNENAYVILARVEVAMRVAKIAPAEFETYRRAAMASDYENLLRVTRETVNCERW
jgi:hypothetical protein